MGTDVQLYAVVDVTEEDLRRAQEIWARHAPGGIIHEFEPRDKQLVRYGTEYQNNDYPWMSPDTPHWPRVEVRTLQRWASPGYKMWAWPSIHQSIRLLQSLFPDAVVCYGGDTSDWAYPVTEEYIEEMWAAWYETPEDKR